MTEPGAHAPMLLEVESFPARHAFTTRAGGVSMGPYASLNLGRVAGDDPAAVQENRRRVLAAYGADPARTVGVHQVHGVRVVDAGAAGEEVQADAIVATVPGWTLRISVADCVPLLLVAPERGVAAAVHAGWRGTVAGVVLATLQHLRSEASVTPPELYAAIGPTISGPRYQVGSDVVAAFEAAGVPPTLVRTDPEVPERWRVSVAGAVRWQLERAGVAADRIHDGGWCTASDPERFYSHRRDGGATGRHWALVTVP